MYSLLAAKNSGLREEALAFAKELIRTPSPSLQESDVARLVEDHMRALGYDQVLARRVRQRRGHPVGSPGAIDGAAEFAHGHGRGGGRGGWQDSPFNGDVRDDVCTGWAHRTARPVWRPRSTPARC